MKAATDEPTGREQLEHANKIDRACDLFESSWKHGNRPRIAEYLKQSDQSIQSTLLIELVKLDLYYRTAAGETPDLHEYTTQFPQFAEELSHLVDGTGSGLSLTQTWRLPRVKERVAHYELRELVGQGAFSSVWRAWDTKLQRTVAVKLPGAKLMEPLLLDMFLHEARAAAQLDHPHIVPVHDYGEHGDGGYIVFGLVPGVDLKRWLKLRRPTPRDAAAICVKLADALDHAHRLRVVHRDLKPANVIMDGSHQPHITDFGLAKRVDIDSTIAIPGEAVGTLPYMSPEQARGDAHVDAQSDLYSLGIILYEMLSGEVPFVGDRRQVAYQIENDEPQPLRAKNKAIPRDLETICLKCLAKDKPDRYQTTAALRDDLARFLKGEPIRARRINPAARAWRWVRRNRLVAGALAIGGCALLSAVGMMAYTLTAPPLPEPGERMVTLTTVPEDANVAFVPLDELTGEPLPEEIIHCQERTPLHQSLAPGNYLVVAYLDDGSSRFHEVYRRVPDQKELTGGLGAPYRYLRWKILPNGRVEMPRIDIPPADVVEQGMAFIAGSESYQMGRSGSTMIPLHTRSIPSFYMDTTEVSVAEYVGVASTVTLTSDSRYVPVPADDWAISLKWSQAVAFAEALGKRLPHEAEYEFAATLGGTLDYSWEATCADQDCRQLFDSRDGYGPVGTPSSDRLPTKPPIIGLCSNVAEWTMTRQTAYYPGTDVMEEVTARFNFSGKRADYPGHKIMAQRQFSHPEDRARRIVRGGDQTVAEGNPDVSTRIRDPRARWPTDHSFLGPGIGFRGVRSAKPRLSPKDFVHVVHQ